jgi:propionyl-CoA carboxylase alpha chain
MKKDKILVANRGEIALRIIRTAKELGIPSVAVFSTADKNALYVSEATEAYHIGPSSPSESYLNIPKILEVAKKSGATMIHPGYGFLSENEEFARKVMEEGIIFIGPNPDTIKLLGSKIESKKLAIKGGVPVVPGSEGAISDIETAKAIARKIGYPILLKASGGGGGKGMRIVEEEKDLEKAIERASSEAKKAFGDPSVFIEKYIRHPKHVEIQILGDKYGNIIHLFERECSIQRRHQKLIEEAPSPSIDGNLRNKMVESAIKIAELSGYVNAGTVEFIVDEDKNYYFLEVNTRLQVEHPVTEMITGLDIVREQIFIATGEKIDFTPTRRGHAIEFRINAEDPFRNFVPSTGKIYDFKPPDGPFVRFDHQIYPGLEVELHYDSLLGKLIVWDIDRDRAINKGIMALDELEIVGVNTTAVFLKEIANHKAFRDGSYTIRFIEEYGDEILQNMVRIEDIELVGMLKILLDREPLSTYAEKYPVNL